MNIGPKQPPVTRRSFLRSAALAPVALLLAASTGSASLTHNVFPGPSPVLLAVSPVLPQLGLLTVRGEGFTPGGSVFVSISDGGGSTVMDSFWTVASRTVYGPNGSQDPAQGYRTAPAGTIDERITLDASASYGPNGSQDPAQGYRKVTGATCQGEITVQAFDAETRTWSNQVRVGLAC